jgi:hypothetical protein
MSDYVILDNTQAIDITGGFNRVITGSGSTSNPSLTKTNNYYQWSASMNAEYNAPGCKDTPNIFINNPKLLSKYKQLQIKYYRYAWSSRAYTPQGIASYFYKGSTQKTEIFNAFTGASGTQEKTETVTVDIPDDVDNIKIHIGGQNATQGANTTCRVYQIILKHRKGAKLGDKDCEVYLGTTEITDIYLGTKEIG